jgi:hypothetical protein
VTARFFDPGLQPERTALAWRRTTLALAAGAVVSFRLLPPVLGLWSIGVGVAGLLLSATIWILAGRRGRRVQKPCSAPRGRCPAAACTCSPPAS